VRSDEPGAAGHEVGRHHTRQRTGPAPSPPLPARDPPGGSEGRGTLQGRSRRLVPQPTLGTGTTPEMRCTS
jgi:hypothetical protein